MNNDILKDQFMKDVSVIVKNAHISTNMYAEALHQLKFSLGGGGPVDNHNTTSIYNPIYDEYIDIDTNIAPLIKHLWLIYRNVL